MGRVRVRLGRGAVVGVHGEDVRPHAGSSRASSKGLRAKIAKKKGRAPGGLRTPERGGRGKLTGLGVGRWGRRRRREREVPRWLSARPERDRAQWSGGTRGGLRKLSWGQASVDRTVGPTPYLLLYLVSTRY
jgi:hypothetical protein